MVRSSSTFEGALKELIHHFKYRGKDYLSDELSLFLLRTWEKHSELQESEVVLPVPLHSGRLRERGYNQSLLLAKKFVSLVQESGRPSFGIGRIVVLQDILVRVKKSASQTELSREERIRNVESLFRVKDPTAIYEKKVLLIDDVCTTGSTLNECSKILKEAGAKEILGLTLARD